MNKVITEEKAWNEFTLEEILKQNEKRIHYHIHRLGIHDSHQEFYTEGLYAMWMAYRKYEPNKGPLGTYFNYMIRNRLRPLGSDPHSFRALKCNGNIYKC